MNRGTKIILSLKEDMKEYLEEKKLRELVQRYSEFINFPIYLYCQKEVSKEVELEEGEEVPEEEIEETPETEEPIKIEMNDEDDNNDPVLDEK